MTIVVVLLNSNFQTKILGTKKDQVPQLSLPLLLNPIKLLCSKYLGLNRNH